MERDPVSFLGTDLEPALDVARADLAGFLGPDPADLVFVPNATTGISTVVRALVHRLTGEDEILITDHEYNATFNAVRWLSRQTGAKLVIAQMPFPIRDAEQATDAIRRATTRWTRIAVVSHVTSATALVLPAERIVAALGDRGVHVLVDGAHAPGMVPGSARPPGGPPSPGHLSRRQLAVARAVVLPRRVRSDRYGRPDSLPGAPGGPR